MREIPNRCLGVLLAIAALPSLAATPLPDPTRPAGYFARKLADQELPQEIVNWNVSAIRIAGQQRTAIINGRSVQVGDQVGKGTVLEIHHDHVVLDYNRQQFVVNLLPYNIKKNQAATD